MLFTLIHFSYVCELMCECVHDVYECELMRVCVSIDWYVRCVSL